MPAWYANGVLATAAAAGSGSVPFLTIGPLRGQPGEGRRTPAGAMPHGAAPGQRPQAGREPGKWRWNWSLWGLWVVASALGGTAGWFLGRATGEVVGAALNPEGGMILFFPLVPGLLESLVLAASWIGPFMGVAQWLVLQPRLPGAVAWLLLSAIQGLVAFLLVLLPLPMSWLLLVALVGVGVGQWLVLRPHGRQAGWWLAAYALSWGLSIAAAVPVLGSPAPGVIIGALFGVISGVALVWILS